MKKIIVVSSSKLKKDINHILSEAMGMVDVICDLCFCEEDCEDKVLIYKGNEIIQIDSLFDWMEHLSRLYQTDIIDYDVVSIHEDIQYAFVLN